DAGGHMAAMAALFQDIAWEGQRARYQLLQADTAWRQGDTDGCHKHLETAARWILHSGSVEHLCYLHVLQARAARFAAEHGAARRAVEAGLHLARRCGLGLYHIELLCEQAELLLACGDAAGAEAAARDARQRALRPDCQFLWGAAVAGHLLG